ncbi:serine/threonine protein kinase [Nocardiopsis ansamitocini]|uniref:non-specific serine/threonine protein kinase n=1 Tax=Nocardiopsis ansamitocini TaxID=1670832 RepID=A0A9W6P8C9_9ACTN|nr:serine/threonine-protein kinase [Nocardiopsis ansamitocini]GLU48986.1 hypothetical protein Nans01_33370 [Nocardiopsis ansamitocini]
MTQEAANGENLKVGGYRLQRLLGEGGFGAVYLGEDDQGRLAAVKLLHRGQATEGVRESLSREIEAARKVSPFCIAQVFDADLFAPQPWIATEYLEGPTLAERVHDRGPLSGAGLQRLAISTATALTAIHRAGILHRDFKPDNIILAPDGPRVIDFGIAKATEQTKVLASAVIGTPAYMAPEQIEGVALTPHVDVFSWGAVMAYAATGRNAFDGPNVPAVIKRVIMDEPDLAGLDPALLPVVRRCLEKEPGRRYRAHELLNTLLGAGERGMDTESALSEGSTAVEKLEPTGPRRSSAASSFAYRSQPPPVASGVVTGPGHQLSRSARSVPPFEFAGRRFYEPGALAEAMQGDWPAAVLMFGDSLSRGDLRDWIIDDLGDTLVNRAVLRREPEAPDLAVARFVADLRPDLAPRYRGFDMRMGLLKQNLVRGDGVNPAAVDTLVRAFFVPGMRRSPIGWLEEVLSVMATHHCADPRHSCPSEAPCQGYQMLVRDYQEAARAVFRTAQHINRILAQGHDSAVLFEPDRPDTAVLVLARLLAGERRSEKEDQLVSTTTEAWTAAFQAAAGPVTGPARAGADALLGQAGDVAHHLGSLEHTCRREQDNYVAAIDKAVRVHRWYEIGSVAHPIVCALLLLGLVTGCVADLSSGGGGAGGYFTWILVVGVLSLVLRKVVRNSADFPGRQAHINYLKQTLYSIRDRIAQAEGKRHQLERTR